MSPPSWLSVVVLLDAGRRGGLWGRLWGRSWPLALATTARVPWCVRVDAAGTTAAAAAAPPDADQRCQVRITAPRGRLASTGPIPHRRPRHGPAGAWRVASVKFYLDDQLLGEDAAEAGLRGRMDRLATRSCRITFASNAADDLAGHRADDDLALEPLEVLGGRADHAS